MVSMTPIYRKKKSRLSERGAAIAAADSAASRKSIIWRSVWMSKCIYGGHCQSALTNEDASNFIAGSSSRSSSAPPEYTARCGC